MMQYYENSKELLIRKSMTRPTTHRGDLTRVERTRTRPEWLIRVSFESGSPPVQYSFGSSFACCSHAVRMLFACCSHAVRVLVQREKLDSDAIRMLNGSFELVRPSRLIQNHSALVRVLVQRDKLDSTPRSGTEQHANSMRTACERAYSGTE